jgi:sensor histidine kinase YesM
VVAQATRHENHGRFGLTSAKDSNVGVSNVHRRLGKHEKLKFHFATNS